MDVEKILGELGLSFKTISRVSGGDINHTYKLSGGEKDFFVKLNDAKRFPGMFVCEAEGLKSLESATSIQIPKVINLGESGNYQFLILEWIERGPARKDFWEHFGKALATMHRKPQAYFGYESDNYIGSLHQKNKKTPSWELFYAEQRILPICEELVNLKLFSMPDVNAAESFCKKLKEIFPKETPSLLHGDLWSGNFMIAADGHAAMYDPAVYYGHREMDLGMTLLFGGFEKTFYEAYDEAYPLEQKWKSRVEFTQLYPLLVHAVLFGGSYVQSARTTFRKFS